MSHEIDLKNYEVRTDLAIELVDSGKENLNKDHIKVTDINLNGVDAKKINKKEGHYITIEFDDVTDYDNKEKIKDVLTRELTKLIKPISLTDNSLILVVGLGNRKTAPDALGPLVIDKVLVTNHLALYGHMEKGFKRVCALTPGVMGETGIETSDLLYSLVSSLKPDLVITIDALAASSIERLNKTIQMTDAGINPGSGVGNKRKEISKDTLKVPVIAIGVPTVVDATSIVSDTINYMYKHFAYSKEKYNDPASKLQMGVNYLKKDIKMAEEDKKNLFGIVGSLNDNDIKHLIFEVLNPIGYNLMVTPKEEDFVIEKLADLISEGINQTLHDKVNHI